MLTDGLIFTPILLSCQSLSSLWQPESEAEVGAGGEGTSGGAVKRGLSLEAAATGQDVKRFRTATGAASTVSLKSPSRMQL